MTKEMAITILRGDVLGTDEQTHEAVFMAIKALKEQERVDAVEVVRCKDCRWYENDGYHTNCKIMQFCVEAEDYCSRGERREDDNTETIRTLVEGHWIKDKGIYKCTACNSLCTVAGWADCIPEKQMYKVFRFCPNCGARMDEVEDETG